jgi:hypothetical protein
MGLEIKQEDLDRFAEFEKSILNLKESGIKYSHDFEIETDVKLASLYDTFGKEKTKDFLKKIKLTKVDLADQDTYIKIYNFLSSIK